jgi:hypothetical protein
MQDLLPLSTKHCYSCMNWEGVRTVYTKDKKVKADSKENANCVYWHKKVLGGKCCEQFNPIRG